jgi:hypothetical protein
MAQQANTRARELRLDLQGAGGCWMRDVVLIRDTAGTRLRIDGEVYDLGAWMNLPLSQSEVEAIFRAIAAAGA